jgi:hypothetical protein
MRNALRSLTAESVLMTRWLRYSAILTVLALAACHGSSPAPTQPTQPPPPQTGPPPVPPLPVPNANDPLDGSFTLTLQIGSSCSAIPDAEKTRVYDASIGQVPNRTDLGHVVTLGGSRFLTGSICNSGVYPGIGCNQFLGSEDIDWVGFWLQNNNDDAHGAHIVEQTSSGAWLEIMGHADGTLTNYASIEAAGAADVWFCPTSSAYPYPCPEYRFCPSTDLHLRFSRK